MAIDKGYIAGRYFMPAVDADGEQVPARGLVHLARITEENTTVGTVTAEPISYDIGPDGWVLGHDGETPFALAAGRYDVSFTLAPHRTPQPRPFRIELTTGHTEEAPLNLSEHAPLIIPEGMVGVVTMQTRFQAEAARDAAQAAQDAAEVAQAGAESARTTAQSHRDSARGYRDEAREAADEATAPAEQMVENAIDARDIPGQVGTAVTTAVGQVTEDMDAAVSTAEGHAAAATSAASTATEAASTASTAREEAVTARNETVAARDGMVVGGAVDGDELVLQTLDGGSVNAGNVRGPQGERGPVGTGLQVEGTVQTSSELPDWTPGDPEAVDGAGYITADTGHLWVWSDADGWIEAGQVKGPQGDPGVADDASMTAIAQDPASAFRASLEGTIDSRTEQRTDQLVPGLVDDRLAQQPEVVDAAAQRAGEAATDPLVAGVLADPESASSQAAYARHLTVAEGPLDPHRYGAVGDGATDDTAALQAAVDVIRDAGEGTLRLRPGRVYVVSSLDVQGGLSIDGTGATLRRPANTPNWVRTITNENRQPAASAHDAEPIILRGLTIDGNIGQQGSYTNYELQQSMLINVQGNPAGAGRQPVVAEGLRLRGSVSDGIHIWRNVDATIRDLDAVDCFRGGVVITGGHTIVRLDNYRGHGAEHGAHIDVEIDSSGYNSSKRVDFYGRNIRLETEYPTARSLNLDALDGGIVEVDGILAASGLYLSAPTGRARIRNGTIHTFSHDSYRNVRTSDAIFENIHFIGHTAGPTSTRQIVQVSHHVASAPTGSRRRVEFRNCEFDVANPHASWDAVFMESVPAVDSGHTIVSGGRIGQGIKRGVVLQRGGTATIRDRPRIESERMIDWVGVGSEGRPVDITIEQVDLGPTCTTPWYVSHGDAANVIRHMDTVIDETHNKIGVAQLIGQTQFIGARIINVGEPPADDIPGLRGDRARLKAPSAGQVAEWICVNPSAAAAWWRPSITVAP